MRKFDKWRRVYKVKTFETTHMKIITYKLYTIYIMNKSGITTYKTILYVKHFHFSNTI